MPVPHPSTGPASGPTGDRPGLRTTGSTPVLATTTVGPDRSAATVGPPLLLLHGFTQNAGCWGPLLGDLARDRPVVAVDLPGHGGSARVSADLWGTADLVAEVAAAVPGPVDLLGYSLGGRVGLHVALAHPDRVRRLVLVGATPGLPDDATRAARRRTDEQLAGRLVAEPLADVLDEWLAQPLFRTLPAEAAGRAARLGNDPAGLADSLRSTGTGTQEPLWGRLPELAMPVLLLAGVLDVRFAATAAAMARGIGPNARLTLVPAAGHACHLERPAYVGRVVRHFLA